MTERPKMHARDCSGRRVSLLNDEPAVHEAAYVSLHPSPYATYDPSNMARSHSTTSIQSRTSSPLVPDLVRADSCDSHNNNDVRSPTTPTYLHQDFGRLPSYPGNKAQAQAHFDYREALPSMEEYSPSHLYALPALNGYSSRTPYPEPRMYDEDHYHHQSRVPQERAPKRYPCRHKDTHNCDRTFTTSGHASRHSKIHTAEKSVACTWQGCQKKFTRGDNMKQHLETHTKDRSRASTAQKPTAMRTLTMPAGVRKPTSVGSRPSSRNTGLAVDFPVDPALYQQPPTMSPYGAASPPFYPSPISSRRDSMSSGLDALATIASDSRYRS
ncbi:hypothetical protein LZ554_005131 [Drepanopeziza brunnea f. sp. 'monogermtubi']|nr:hypothetical protein LZ554_005131 [Drepanopeziza brunnea f. sp. 'monogermtubi']